MKKLQESRDPKVPPAYFKFDPEIEEENIETDYIYAIYKDENGEHYIVGDMTPPLRDINGNFPCPPVCYRVIKYGVNGFYFPSDDELAYYEEGS